MNEEGAIYAIGDLGPDGNSVTDQIRAFELGGVARQNAYTFCLGTPVSVVFLRHHPAQTQINLRQKQESVSQNTG
jgi:hypothetical protein